jgi:shikimate 5-dehydrogenase
VLGEGSLGEFLNQHDDQGATVRVVISTLPATAKFVLPGWIYERSAESKPVVFDVNYKPYNTDLLRQADSMGCPVVRGSEMLWEQGVGQFELWMERTAPYRVMKQVVLENCVEAMSQV